MCDRETAPNDININNNNNHDNNTKNKNNNNNIDNIESNNKVVLADTRWAIYIMIRSTKGVLRARVYIKVYYWPDWGGQIQGKRPHMPFLLFSFSPDGAIS